MLFSSFLRHSVWKKSPHAFDAWLWPCLELRDLWPPRGCCCSCCCCWCWWLFRISPGNYNQTCSLFLHMCVRACVFVHDGECAWHSVCVSFLCVCLCISLCVCIWVCAWLSVYLSLSVRVCVCACANASTKCVWFFVHVSWYKNDRSGPGPNHCELWWPSSKSSLPVLLISSLFSPNMKFFVSRSY